MQLVHPTILITDDDRAFRETLRELFARRGFDTLLAGDGDEALQIVRHNRIHVVLLDMHMPRRGGLETIQGVKQVDAELPCILISGGLDDQTRRQAEAANFFGILEKPVRLDAVTSVVAAAFHRRYDWVL